MELRYYQREAIDQTFKFMRASKANPCIDLPTGAGKSIVIAQMLYEALTFWPGTRVFVLAHVKELVRQNAEKLLALWPDAPVGIYSASLGARDTLQPLIFANIQSVHSRVHEFRAPNLVLVDEAHRIPVRSKGMYQAFIAACKDSNPALRVIGLTATPYRLGSGMVCGPKDVLNEISYSANVGKLIEEGYLSKLVSKGGLARADISNVHIRGGEYIPKELDIAVSNQEVVDAAVKEMVDLCKDRKAWIIFCASIRHATMVSNTLLEHGIKAPVVSSESTKADRDYLVSEHAAGRLRALCNVNILSEGYDAPHIDAVILLRPTKSTGLYYQQVGRGLRLSPGKENCLILDFAGNIAEHGPIDAINPPKADRASKKGEPGEPLVKMCIECQTMVPMQIMQCPDCGYEFPPPIVKAPHETTASNASILSGEMPAYLDEVTLSDVVYTRHEKPGKTPSMRVDYYAGFDKVASEWVFFEHSGWGESKARRWWREHSPNTSTPRSVDEALERIGGIGIRRPTSITLNTRGKYPEVVDYHFEEKEADIPFGPGTIGVQARISKPCLLTLSDDEIPF